MKQIVLKKEWGDWFNVIGVWPFKIDGKYKIFCLKEQINFHADKAIGAIHWMRKILGDKHFPCFIYCPDVETIYGDGIGFNNKDMFADDDDLFSEKLNEKKVEELIERFAGYLPVDSWDEWILNKKQAGNDKIKIIEDMNIIFEDPRIRNI